MTKPVCQPLKRKKIKKKVICRFWRTNCRYCRRLLVISTTETRSDCDRTASVPVFISVSGKKSRRTANIPSQNIMPFGGPFRLHIYIRRHYHSKDPMLFVGMLVVLSATSSGINFISFISLYSSAASFIPFRTFSTIAPSYISSTGAWSQTCIFRTVKYSSRPFAGCSRNFFL